MQAYQARIALLENRLGELDNRPKLNSTNSSDPIGMKRKPPAPRGGKKRGGQRGHRKAPRPLVPGVPAGCFGPYLQAVLATFAGAYRLGKRQVRRMAADLFTLSISTGMISTLEWRSAVVLEVPCDELATAVHQAEVVNIDETSWRENRLKAWLWRSRVSRASAG